MGLDIGSSAVKAIELKPSGKGFKVTAFGVEPIPPDSIVDGAIIDGGAVADAVRRLFENKQFSAKEVAASLSGNSVIVKKITLPTMTEQELGESIYWEAEQYIPFDIQDVNLDYEILSPEGAQGTMDVLLVAAKKDKIADYTSVITQAGRTAVVVDVDAFALQNAYEVNYGFESGAVVALLNAGASATNINILNGPQSVFTRDISMGGNAFTEAVQRELGLPYELAEQLKKGEDVEGATYDDARPVLKAMTDNILLEVEKTFDFFKATASNDRIDRIVLSGGASRVDGFAEALASRFNTEVISFDPFRQVSHRRLEAGRVVGRRPGAGRGGGRGPRASQGGRPMIRINLIATERKTKAASKGLNVGQKMTVIGSLVLILATLGIGWRYWALEQSAANIERAVDRCAAGRAAAGRDPQAGARVRSPARSAAAARDADRRTAARADGAGPHHRPDEPRASRNDLADAGAADRLRRHDRRPLPVAHLALRLHRQPRGLALLQAAGRNPVERSGQRRQRRPRHDSIHDQGVVPDGRHRADCRRTAGRQGPGGQEGASQGRPPWLVSV